MYKLLDKILIVDKLCYFDPEKLILFSGNNSNSEEENIQKYREQLKHLDVAENCLGNSKEPEKTAFSLELHITEKCNLKCRYCYIDDGILSKTCQNTKDMKKESIEKAFNFVLKEFPELQTISISLFGGEPLFFDDFGFILQKAKEVFHSQKLHITFPTNGTYLNEDLLKILANKEISFSLSLDGDKEFQDFLRPSFQEKSSYDLVEKNFSKFKKLDQNFLVRTTITPYNLNLTKIFNFFCNKGVKKIRFIVSSCSIKEFEINESVLEKILEEYEKLADVYLQHLINNEEIVQITDFFRIFSNLYFRRKQFIHCSRGKNIAVVSLDEKLYPCHRFVENESFLIGDLDNGFYEDSAVRKECLSYNVDQEKLCQQCFAKYLCGGGCLHEKIMMSDNIVCKLRRHITYLSIKMYATLLLKYPKAFEKVKRQLLLVDEKQPEEKAANKEAQETYSNV